METNIIYSGGCLVKLRDLSDESIDFVYLREAI